MWAVCFTGVCGSVPGDRDHGHRSIAPSLQPTRNEHSKRGNCSSGCWRNSKFRIPKNLPKLIAYVIRSHFTWYFQNSCRRHTRILSAMMMMVSKTLAVLFCLTLSVEALVPFFDGGKGVPKLYDGWINEQIAKQARTAVGKAVAAGKKKIEVNFPPVPNVDEVKFGTPMNQKFGKNVVAKDLGVPGGYRPGSNVSRQLIAFSNMYWAKQIAPALAGSPMGGNTVSVLTAEPVPFREIKKIGVSAVGTVSQGPIGGKDANENGAVIVVNPGGEETWDKIYSRFANPSAPFLVLNNAYSTTYDLGNKKGYEEAYYLKRISKGWVFRQFPGNWEAYIERPDGSVELLKTYRTKPPLNEVATLVRDTSFKRYAINNDRYAKGFGGRL
eukprot:scaffold4707_cov164-Amphora_coffeaeformis.AAC.33